MKNLKDYLKLIFTAVMGFIMSLLPNKKIVGKVPAEAVLKEKRNTGMKVCGLEDVLVASKEAGYVIERFESLYKREILRAGKPTGISRIWNIR